VTDASVNALRQVQGWLTEETDAKLPATLVVNASARLTIGAHLDRFFALPRSRAPEQTEPYHIAGWLLG
jgi:hypothetical protein